MNSNVQNRTSNIERRRNRRKFPTSMLDVQCSMFVLMVELLLHKGVELLSFCLDAVHFHLLGRFGK